MNKLQKASILILIFVFLLPIVTAFCCCLELTGSEKSSHSYQAEVASHHGDGREHPYQNSGYQHKKEAKEEPDCGQHDHSQCSHPQLIANFVNNATQFFAAQISYLQKFSRAHFKELAFFQDSVKPESSPLFLNTGPPVFDSSKTPLYLQISVLRI